VRSVASFVSNGTASVTFCGVLGTLSSRVGAAWLDGWVNSMEIGGSGTLERDTAETFDLTDLADLDGDAVGVS
jgi:hypothetical protein